MKKVLHLTLYLDIGGLERMVWILCRGQKAAGWIPQVVVYEKGTADLLPHFQRDQIPVTFFPKGKGFSFRLPFRILRHLKKNEISLIHTHDLGALIYGSLVRILSLGKIRIVHTQHSFQHLPSRKARLYERIFPWFAERIVCVSEDLRRTYLTLGHPLERLRIVPNGVDFSLPKPDPTARLELRRRLLKDHGLPESLESQKWVITLGRLAKVKGPARALSLWNSANTGSAVLFLVGPESYPGTLAALRAQGGRNVFFPGSTLDSHAWLSATDLFLSASEFEGLPLAALEAAAAGRPMLISQIPGHALFHGWAAYFPLNNVKEGARILETYLQNGSTGAGTQEAAALERLEQGGGARRMTERYLSVYGELR
ncbi:MAG: glycosyltransferase family 4 protein [Bdellovibrionota bacterium]